ncbi:DUF1566 domain-containing protein, partial [Vibrio cholerae]|nr:DUF1566 domain-containing protein [Vibrio cholerae]
LMWTRTPDSAGRTWEEALAFADNLVLCGFADWRLPNFNELESLINLERSDPAAWLNTQGFLSVGGENWTSTTEITQP